MIDGFALKVALIVIAVISFGFGKYYFRLKDDNAVEEVAEEIIEYATDIDIDLTPGSPEAKSKV